MADLKRIQLDMPEDRVKELDALKEDLGFRSRAELFNNALDLYFCAVDEYRKGNQLAFVNPNESRYQVVRIPAFRNLQIKVALPDLVPA